MSIYTKKVCKLFSEEVDKSAHYNVVAGDSFDEVKVVHYNEEKRKKWARTLFVVKIKQDEGKLSCECGMFEHFGILCCHAIKVSVLSFAILIGPCVSSQRNLSLIPCYYVC
jgi:hypothetical protein